MDQSRPFLDIVLASVKHCSFCAHCNLFSIAVVYSWKRIVVLTTQWGKSNDHRHLKPYLRWHLPYRVPVQHYMSGVSGFPFSSYMSSSIRLMTQSRPLSFTTSTVDNLSHWHSARWCIVVRHDRGSLVNQCRFCTASGSYIVRDISCVDSHGGWCCIACGVHSGVGVFSKAVSRLGWDRVECVSEECLVCFERYCKLLNAVL